MMERHAAIKKIKKDVDALLIDNSDHFSENAQDAYRIGHALAMKMALDAGKRKNSAGESDNPEELKLAYAVEAYACHFLTDLFAAGHIRNQRGALESFLVDQLEFSSKSAKKLAAILTGAQHEKDGNDGLDVSNQEGNFWRAYGDGCFFIPKNKPNKDKAIAATILM